MASKIQCARPRLLVRYARLLYILRMMRTVLFYVRYGSGTVWKLNKPNFSIQNDLDIAAG